jgi:hypothetical protein
MIKEREHGRERSRGRTCIELYRCKLNSNSKCKKILNTKENSKKNETEYSTINRTFSEGTSNKRIITM